MTDIKSARGLALSVAREYWHALTCNPPVIRTWILRAAANTIRDLCDEVERLREEIEDSISGKAFEGNRLWNKRNIPNQKGGGDDQT